MSSALEVAAVGMRAQQRALDAIANNVSNINTPAYKRSDLRFSEIVSAASDSERPEGVRANTVSGLVLSARPTIDQSGEIDVTGNPQDIAIDGKGFIELMGPAGRVLLWRGGSLRVLEDGALATDSGHVLKAGINVPVEASAIRIERDGQVFALMPDQAEIDIGRISLARLTGEGEIARFEGGIYSAGDDSAILEAPPGEDGLGYLVQSALERSNVDLNTELVNLLVSQRAYAANAQVVRAADQLYEIANNLRR